MFSHLTAIPPLWILSLASRLALIVLFMPSAVFGQATLRGTVSDSSSHEPLVGVNVVIQGSPLGCATNIEGQYTIAGIPERIYRVRVSCIGYEAKVTQIDFSKRNVVQLNVRLRPIVIEGQEVVITAQMRGQMAAINRQVTSNTIVNVVSEEKIQELPDANAAESIGRLPGVSLIRSGGEANKVLLRGMADKFSSVTIDGVRVPPTDADSRGVDLSVISQGSLAGVELYKALTPDKDADAIAGSINLETKKAPSERFIRTDIKGNYNKLMKSVNQYDLALHYGERFFNDVLGIQLTGNLEKRSRSNERISLNYGQQDRPDYFINDFGLEFTDEIRKRDGLTCLIDLNTPDEGTIRFNNVYGGTNRDYLWSTRDYPSNGGGSQQGNPSYDYRDREQEIKTVNSSLRGDNHILGFSLKWGLSFAQSQSRFPFDYETIFVEPSGMNASPMLTSGPEQLISYALNNFSNASLYWAYYRSQDNFDKERTGFADVARQYSFGDNISGELKIGGKVRVKDRSNTTNENFTPYYLGRWQSYEFLPDGTVRPKDFTGTSFEAWQKSGGGFIGLDQFLPGTSTSRDVYGSYALKPLVQRDKLRQWWELNQHGVDVTGNQMEVWTNPLIKYDDYFVTERVTAGYVMNTLNVGQVLTVIAGVRIEREDNDYLSTFMPKPVSGFPVPSASISDTTSSYAETIVLPNVNVSFRPTGIMNIRLAAYKALGRPDFNMRLNRYIAGRPAEVGTQFQVYVGNPSLRTSQAWNYEVNTTLSDNSFGLISLSVYYKEIEDMYHMLNNFNTTRDSLLAFFGSAWKSQMKTTPYDLTIPYNSPRPTKLWGFELEHQLNFQFLPGLLKNIVLSYNASIVRSEAYVYGSRTVTFVDSSGPFPLTKSKNILVERKQKLEGMPEFFGNISLGYDIGGFSARLSVFHKGEHNVSFSATGLNDRVTSAFTRIDLALKQRVTQHVALIFTVNNLTNIEEGTSIRNRVFDRTLFDQSEQYGLTADFGVIIEL
jgi:TonB-dependent receptor